MAITGIILGLLFVGNVYAADPAAPDPTLCRALTAYTPSADVDYKPGVDVRGHYVAPADIDSSGAAPLPKIITIPLTVSLAKILNLDTNQYPASQFGAGTEAQIGTLTVDGNKVLLNGKPLSGDQQSRLAAGCLP